jgi:hypothetical protein
MSKTIGGDDRENQKELKKRFEMDAPFHEHRLQEPLEIYIL